MKLKIINKTVKGCHITTFFDNVHRHCWWILCSRTRGPIPPSLRRTEILFLVLRILFFKNRVGGRNKIKNKIFLQVPIHMEYWMSEILHSIYNMMGFRKKSNKFSTAIFKLLCEVIFTCCHSGTTKIQLFQYIRLSNVCRVYMFHYCYHLVLLEGRDNSYIYWLQWGSNLQLQST